MIQAVLKDTMVNTHKTMGDGCWILGVELKTALLQLFRPPSLFHSYVSEYSNSVSSANFFHEKKYFSS